MSQTLGTPAPTSAPARGARRAAVLTLLARWALPAGTALVMLMTLWWPLGYDQGVYASNGDVVARGGAPYRDAWDVKGPLVFYMSAAIQLVFGRHAWGVRAADLVIALLTARMLWRCLNPIVSRNIAFIAAAAWPVSVAALNYSDSAQYDLWVGSAILCAVLLVTRRDGYGARDLVLAGALVGLASLTKPIFPAFLAVPGVVVLMRCRTPASAIRGVALLVAGCVVPVAAALALLWWQGALEAAWDVHILYNLNVYAPGAGEPVSKTAIRVKGVVEYLYRSKVAVLVAPALAGAVVLWERRPVLAAALLTWIFVGAGLVVLQAKFWLYHWATIYPALVLLVAVGMHGVLREARAWRSRAGAALVWTTAAVLVGLWSIHVPFDLRNWLLYMLGRRGEAAYHSTFTAYGEIDPGHAKAVAEYIRSHTPPGAPFAHWTIHGGLSFLADRPNATRFQNRRDLTRASQHPITQGYRREYLERVRRVNPTHIAVQARSDLGPVSSSRDALQRDFPELARLVAERYQAEARFGDIDVYRLCSPGTGKACVRSHSP